MATPKPCLGQSPKSTSFPTYNSPLVPGDLTGRASIPLTTATRRNAHKNGHMKKGSWKDSKGEKFFNRFDDEFGLFNLELFQLAKAAMLGGLVQQEVK